MEQRASHTTDQVHHWRNESVYELAARMETESTDDVFKAVERACQNKK